MKHGFTCWNIGERTISIIVQTPSIYVHMHHPAISSGNSKSLNTHLQRSTRNYDKLSTLEPTANTSSFFAIHRPFRPSCSPRSTPRPPPHQPRSIPPSNSRKPYPPSHRDPGPSTSSADSNSPHTYSKDLPSPSPPEPSTYQNSGRIPLWRPTRKEKWPCGCQCRGFASRKNAGMRCPRARSMRGCSG